MLKYTKIEQMFEKYLDFALYRHYNRSIKILCTIKSQNFKKITKPTIDKLV